MQNWSKPCLQLNLGHVFNGGNFSVLHRKEVKMQVTWNGKIHKFVICSPPCYVRLRDACGFTFHNYFHSFSSEDLWLRVSRTDQFRWYWKTPDAEHSMRFSNLNVSSKGSYAWNIQNWVLFSLITYFSRYCMLTYCRETLTAVTPHWTFKHYS